jgi:hypothetical protein
VSGAVLDPPRAEGFLLDIDTGTLLPFEPVKDFRVDYAVCSPWRDASGGFEVVARIAPRYDNDTPLNGSALARFPLSGGPVRLETAAATVIGGAPCWLPNSPRRVVFSGGDGRLYRQDLSLTDDDRGDADTAGAQSGTPCRVTWTASEPADGKYFLSDPSFPPIPALKGRVLVSMTRRSTQTAVKGRMGSAEIWWLQLDPSGESILDAGRLTPGRGEDAPEERMPTLAALPDGRLALAYLTRERVATDWRLKVAPIDHVDDDGTPVVLPGDVHDLGGGFGVAIPAFSSDGAWLSAITRRPQANRSLVRRFELSAVLAATPSRRFGRTTLAALPRPR